MKLTDIKLVPIIESIQILDIDDETYFSSEYKNYISNSKLKLINPEEGGSPELYQQGLGGNYSASLYFGSCCHELILQPESFFLVESVNRPTSKAGYMADELYPIFKERNITLEDGIKASNKISYYKGKYEDKHEPLMEKILPYLTTRKEFEKTNKETRIPIYIDEKSRTNLKSCIKSVEENLLIQHLLHPEGIIEHPESWNEICYLIDIKAIFPDGKEIILPFKGKFDNYTLDYEMNKIVLNDLKTSGHYFSQFVKSYYKYHYFRQMAIYSWILWLAYKKLGFSKLPIINANMLVVSTIPPNESGVFIVNDKHIKRGMDEFKKLMKLVAYYERYGYDSPQPEL